MPAAQGKLSLKAKQFLEKAQNNKAALFISSLSILEIWSNVEYSETSPAILINFLKLLKSFDTIRIVDISDDLMPVYAELLDNKYLLEHDRIIYATAISFDCKVFITTDEDILKYNEISNDRMEIIS